MQARLRSVLAWCLPRTLSSFEAHSSELTRVFGNQTSNKFGRWLRARLLVSVEAMSGKTYWYDIDVAALEQLLQLVKR